MTDQPGRPPEERLPAPVPSSAPEPAERFSAPPSAHRNDLTPERAAKIVRQSANARWAAFLAVTIVGLFVIGYYFYELGLPGGLTESRLEAAASEQQVVSVERGYNIYQANCAQCHGANGEGGKGPALNRQDKLYAHLNPDYLNNILHVGGRYACGDPNSIMPIWANTGNPPGPAQLQADRGPDRVHPRREGDRAVPGHGPGRCSSRSSTRTRARRRRSRAGSTRTTRRSPARRRSRPAGPTSSPLPAPRPARAARPARSGSPAAVRHGRRRERAQHPVRDRRAAGPVGHPVHDQVREQRRRDPAQHRHQGRQRRRRVRRARSSRASRPRTYAIPALAAGTYNFLCTVHPNMVGTIVAGG